MQRRNSTRVLIFLGGLSLVAPSAMPTAAFAQSAEEVRRAVESLKGVNIEGLKQSEINLIDHRLDQSWKTIKNAGPSAAPVLRTALQSETAKSAQPDFFFLLDASHLLWTIEPGKNLDVIAPALAQIHPDNPTILGNAERHFELTYELAQTGRPEALPALIPFLRAKEMKVSVPQHAMTLSAYLICVFLFGSYGPAAEDMLLGRLESHPEERLRILETLDWIGTDKVVGPVGKLYASGKSYDVLVRCLSVLAHRGGEAGHKILMETPIDDKDGQFREFYAKNKFQLGQWVYESCACAMQEVGKEESGKHLPRQELDRALDALYQTYGKDEWVSAITILASGDAADAPKLLAIRRRILCRLSDEALYDFKTVNCLIAALKAKATAPSISDLKKQAELGSAEAQLRLYMRYACALDVPADKKEAMRYLRSAAEQGYEPARQTLELLAEMEKKVHSELAKRKDPTIYFVSAALGGINDAESTYASTHGGGFSETLRELEGISAELASGTMYGYRFTYVPGPKESWGKIAGYSVHADPTNPKATVGAHFYTDNSRIIRTTNENRPASAQDSPIE